MAGPSGTTTNTYYRYTASFIIVENRGLNLSITRTRTSGPYDDDKVEILNQTDEKDRQMRGVLIRIATHFIACVLGLEVTTLSKKYLDEIMLV